MKADHKIEIARLLTNMYKKNVRYPYETIQGIYTEWFKGTDENQRKAFGDLISHNPYLKLKCGSSLLSQNETENISFEIRSCGAIVINITMANGCVHTIKISEDNSLCMPSFTELAYSLSSHIRKASNVEEFVEYCNNEEEGYKLNNLIRMKKHLEGSWDIIAHYIEFGLAKIVEDINEHAETARSSKALKENEVLKEFGIAPTNKVYMTIFGI